MAKRNSPAPYVFSCKTVSRWPAVTRKSRSNCLFLLALLLWAELPLFAFTSKDAITIFSSYNSAFYIQSGTNGWFKDKETGGISYFWTQAEEIECIIDAYEWSSNTIYQAQITNLLNGFLKNN